MKVMHIQLFPILSGVQKVSLEEFVNNKSKIEYSLITKCDGPFVGLSQDHGVQCFNVPTLVREISPLNDALSLFGIIKILRKVRPDVVHTHSSKTGILGRVGAYFTSVGLIVHTVHGFGFPAAKSRFVKYFYFIAEFIVSRFTDVLIVMNESDYILASKYFKNKRCRIEFLKNAINQDIYYPCSVDCKESSKSNIFPPNKIIIGFVGRLDAQKNPLEFIRGAIKVLSTRDDIIFYIVGDGHLLDEIQLLIKENNLSHLIYLLGWRNDVPELLRMTDILVSTSLYEGMPLNILEAMASGTAVLASRVTGNIDLIRHGFNGSLYDLGDQNQLVSLLVDLIHSTDLRERYIKSSLEIINKNHKVKLRMKSINAIYALKF